MASEEGHFIQITGFGSFNLGKELYRAGGADRSDLDDGSGLGRGRVGYFTNPKLGFELSYARTSGDLKASRRRHRGRLPNPADLGGALRSTQADIVRGPVGRDGLEGEVRRGYVVAGVGLTRFHGHPAGPDRQHAGDAVFAWIAGLGHEASDGRQDGPSP
jgi:hypothetical protein